MEFCLIGDEEFSFSKILDKRIEGVETKNRARNLPGSYMNEIYLMLTR